MYPSAFGIHLHFFELNYFNPAFFFLFFFFKAFFFKTDPRLTPAEGFKAHRKLRLQGSVKMISHNYESELQHMDNKNGCFLGFFFWFFRSLNRQKTRQTQGEQLLVLLLDRNCENVWEKRQQTNRIRNERELPKSPPRPSPNPPVHVITTTRR